MTATTRLDPEELAAWRGFLRVHSAFTKELDADLLTEHGLTLSGYEVLLHLSECPDRCARMSAIAASVLLSRSGLTRLVDRLERDGLVRREGVEGDARGSNAVLTAAGHRAFTAARRTHLAGVRERFLQPLSGPDRRALARLWDRMLPGSV